MTKHLKYNPRLALALFFFVILLHPYMYSGKALIGHATLDNGTKIYADITTNTVWTKEGSPYIVMAPITIHKNATLRIEPGAVVVFNNEIRVTVQGALVAEGSDSEKVVFKLLDDTRKPHIYLGLDGGKFILRYTNVNLNIVLSGAYITFFYKYIRGSTIALENSRAMSIFFETEDTLLQSSELRIVNTILLGGFYQPSSPDSYPLWKKIELYDIYVAPYLKTNNSVVQVENSIILDGFGVHSILSSGWTPWMPSNVSVFNSVFIGLFGILYDLRDPTLTNAVYVDVRDSVFIDSTISVEAYTQQASQALLFRNNSIVNSTVMRLLGLGVDARYNWWGDLSGPYSAQVNPLGKGVNIQTITARNETIYPWLGAPPKDPVSLTLRLFPEPLLGRYYFTPVNVTILLDVPPEEKNRILLSFVNVLSHGEPVQKVIVEGSFEQVLRFETPLLEKDLDLVVVTVTSDMRVGIFKTSLALCEKPEVKVEISFVNPVWKACFEKAEGNFIVEPEVKLGIYVDACACSIDILDWLRNNTKVNLELVDVRRGLKIAPTGVERQDYGLYAAIYLFNLADGLYKAYLYVDQPLGQIIKESEEFYVDVSPPRVLAEVVSVERIRETGVYQVTLRVEIEEVLGALLHIYLNQSLIDSLTLISGTHEILFDVLNPGYYLVELQASDALGRTSTYSMPLIIAGEEIARTPATETPLEQILAPTAQIAEATERAVTVFLPSWTFWLLVALIMLIAIPATTLMLRRRKQQKQKTRKLRQE